MISSFKKFKNDFYSKFSDLSIFDGEDFNFFKVALEGLKVNYYSKLDFKTYVFCSDFKFYFLRILFQLKSIINGKYFDFKRHIKLAKKKTDYLIVEPGRYLLNSENKPIPIYFPKIFKKLSKTNNIFYVTEGSIPNCDFIDDEYLDIYSFGISITHPVSKSLRMQLISVLGKIKHKTSFNYTELQNITCAFQKFFVESIFWLNILETLRPKKILMISHYHHEGLIFAAKFLNIKIIEYQHGLISRNDIFYDFPKFIKNNHKDCLFAHQINVFGEFWKKILIEGNSYLDNEIKLIKYDLYYRSEPTEIENNVLENFINTRKVILICTQTYLEYHFINYISKLVTIIDNNLCIIVKVHPQEDISSYSKFNSNSNILITKIPTDVLFNYASYHLTIYSTTAFDALRYNLSTYYIFIEDCSEYIEELNALIGGCIIKDYGVKFWELNIKPKLHGQVFFNV